MPPAPGVRLESRGKKRERCCFARDADDEEVETPKGRGEWRSRTHAHDAFTRSVARPRMFGGAARILCAFESSPVQCGNHIAATDLPRERSPRRPGRVLDPRAPAAVESAGRHRVAWRAEEGSRSNVLHRTLHTVARDALNNVSREPTEVTVVLERVRAGDHLLYELALGADAVPHRRAW